MLDLISMYAFSRHMHMLCRCGLDGYIIYVEYNAKLCMCIHMYSLSTALSLLFSHLQMWHVYSGMFTLKSLRGIQLSLAITYILNCVTLHSPMCFHWCCCCQVSQPATCWHGADVTVRVFKNDARLRKPFRCCSAFSLLTRLGKTQTQLRKMQTQPRKIRKWSCTAFRKLMCVQTQRSSEEAFWFAEEAFQFAAGAAPQTQFGKAFRMSASFFWTRTVALKDRQVIEIT